MTYALKPQQIIPGLNIIQISRGQNAFDPRIKLFNSIILQLKSCCEVQKRK